MSFEKFIGDVIWFDTRRGYGFLTFEVNGVKQNDLFAHYSDIQVEGFKTLYKNQKVSFGLGTNKNGIPKAIEIIVLEK